MNFLQVRILDVIDILLVAALMYYIYKFLKGTFAMNIIGGAIVVYLIWKLTNLLSMNLLSDILGNFIGVGVIAFIVVFKREIRQFLLFLGSSSFNWYMLQSRFSNIRDGKKNDTGIVEIVEAFFKMGQTQTGGLIVFERKNSLHEYLLTGLKTSIAISKPIIESIFFKNAPLHDGATIVSRNTVIATNVVLPVSKDSNLPIHYGLRHRAAIETCKVTDATVLVCSEETGAIKYFKDGKKVSFSGKEELIEIITQDIS